MVGASFPFRVGEGLSPHDVSARVDFSRGQQCRLIRARGRGPGDGPFRRLSRRRKLIHATLSPQRGNS